MPQDLALHLGAKIANPSAEKSILASGSTVDLVVLGGVHLLPEYPVDECRVRVGVLMTLLTFLLAD
jgi:hypothetical protein